MHLSPAKLKKLADSVKTSIRSIFGASAALSIALLAAPAQAGLVFQFNFTADPGAPAFTGEQQTAIVTAGNLFSQMFATHFTNSATLQISVVSQTSGLAAAASEVQFNGGLAGEVILYKVTTGVDLNGAMSDGSIFINLATDFQYDPNAPVDFNNGQIDLFSVFDHELTHALGFGSLIQSGFDDHAKFDEFLTTNAGVRLVDPMTGVVDQAAFDEASLNNGLFDGAKTLTNYGSSASIQGQSGDPTSFSGGLSHLGTAEFSAPIGGSPNQNALLLCCGGLNVTGEPRDYNSAEVGILADLGYTQVSAVDPGVIPEPASITLLGIGGIAAFGAHRMRRRLA